MSGAMDWAYDIPSIPQQRESFERTPRDGPVTSTFIAGDTTTSIAKKRLRSASGDHTICAAASPSKCPRTDTNHEEQVTIPDAAPAVATPNRPFELLTALCTQADVMFYIATTHLPSEDLLKLYSIDKGFHNLVEGDKKSFVLTSARRWGQLIPPPPWDPNTAFRGYERNGEWDPDLVIPYISKNLDLDVLTIWPFRSFHGLCEIEAPPEDSKLQHTSAAAPTGTQLNINNLGPDPLSASAARAVNPGDADNLSSSLVPRPEPRQPSVVPALRYLSMILHRRGILQRLLHSLLIQYHIRLNPKMITTLGKLWLILDQPTTGARAGLIRHQQFFSDGDCYRAAQFNLKLDAMVFGDPLAGEGETGMRRLLWAHKSLATMEAVIARQIWIGEFPVAQAWVRWKFAAESLSARAREAATAIGVPRNEWGALAVEFWGERRPRGQRRDGEAAAGGQRRGDTPLIPPDELVELESVRRGLGLDNELREMLVDGYVDPETGLAYPRPEGWEDWRP